MVFDLSKFRYTPPPKSAGPYDDWSAAELTELFEERAAIAEFEGGQSRDDAELATLDWMKSEVGERRFKVWGSNPASYDFSEVAADHATTGDLAITTI